jgi:hypothetical protein
MCALGNAQYELAQTAEINAENNKNDNSLGVFCEREKQSRKSGLV